MRLDLLVFTRTWSKVIFVPTAACSSSPVTRGHEGPLAKRDRQLRQTRKSGLTRLCHAYENQSLREREVIYSLLDRFTDLICADILVEFLSDE